MQYSCKLYFLVKALLVKLKNMSKNDYTQFFDSEKHFPVIWKFYLTTAGYIDLIENSTNILQRYKTITSPYKYETIYSWS